MSSVSLIDGHMDYTDDEIIKTLECCINDNCSNCPETFGNCELTAMRNALDLLKRQKATIEGLEDKLDMVRQELVETIPMIKEDIKTAKAEAYKEFKHAVRTYFRLEFLRRKRYEKIFDEVESDLLKGLVGERNDTKRM